MTLWLYSNIGVGSGAFLSQSKKQDVNADASSVAELFATHLVAEKIMWPRALLGEMGHPQFEPSILGDDNIPTIAKINNNSNSNKTQHIKIRSNLIRMQVMSMIIEF